MFGPHLDLQLWFITWQAQRILHLGKSENEGLVSVSITTTTLHYTTINCITLQSFTLRYNQLHTHTPITINYATLQSITLHYIPLHSTHYTLRTTHYTLHTTCYTTPPQLQLQLQGPLQLQVQPHYITLHYIPLHHIPVQ